MSADEAAAIRAALAGDEGAFRDLYRIHNASMYRHALRMCGGAAHAAEDVVQEAWARAVRGMGRFEGRASLATWLSRIVTNCALERIRFGMRGGEELPDPDGVPAGGVGRAGAGTSGGGGFGAGVGAGRHERMDLERVFETLPPGYRAVLVLHDVEGYTHQEIAGLLQVSPGTSKSQLSRARAWMRRALGPNYRAE